MGVIKHCDGNQETVAVKKLKTLAVNNPEIMDLQHECAIMKVCTCFVHRDMVIIIVIRNPMKMK